MPHTVPAALQATFETDSFSLAVLVKLIKPNGDIITLTTWDEPLLVNLDGDGALTYSPADLSEVSRFSAQINTALDDGQIKVPINTVFVADDIRREFFAGTNVKIGYVVPTDLANPWLHRVYKSGEININGAEASIELLDIAKALERPITHPLTANCKNEFGDVLCGMTVSVPAWTSATVYAVGDQVKPTSASSLWFIVTVAGTSGGSEPTWSAGTVVDNTVTWTSFNARQQTGTVTGVTSNRAFAASGISIANDYFGNGMIEWLTGSNAGEKPWVRSDDGVGNIVQKRECLEAILIGDTFLATVGCRHRMVEDCVGKHANAQHSSTKTLRFNGDPFIPSENITITAPTE